MYPKDELLQMIYDTDQKGKMLQNASPMVNVSESIHGALVAHTVLGTASLPTVPLGSVNEDAQAEGLVKQAKEEEQLNRNLT